MVLIVDDDRTCADSACRLLQVYRYPACAAYDGYAALAMMRERKPRLLVSDGTMPVMTGFDLLRMVRVDPHLADVPAIFFTATTPTEASEAIAFGELGAVRWVVKDHHGPDRLLQAVREVLGTPL